MNINAPIQAMVEIEMLVTRADGTTERRYVRRKTRFLFWRRALRWACGGGF